ncbi:hypothetical protein QAD02_021271 [Eretmocerus hayati]|uniref:Uncharacterized protein n=1 Tax=Eretmocerus hayati TaxID=131215 RepID=A0ACC2PPT0_9HYME|nr:hypothetical protein QAD02_021271 [Eretmocerus hayati]
MSFVVMDEYGDWWERALLWAFLTFLVEMINSLDILVEVIEINYFEPGHRFTSADSFHADVERKMRNGTVFDFPDFESCVINATARVPVESMQIGDFFDWNDHHSLAKTNKIVPKFYLANVKHPQARRGEYVLFYETRYDRSAPNQELNSLKVKSMKKIPKVLPRTVIQGVDPDHKTEIGDKLCPLMHENRRAFSRIFLKNHSLINCIKFFERDYE